MEIDTKFHKKIGENCESNEKIEMEIESDSLESSKNSIEMNFKNEQETNKLILKNESINNIEKSFGDNYSTENSNMEIERKKENLEKNNLKYNEYKEEFENKTVQKNNEENDLSLNLEFNGDSEKEDLVEIFKNLLKEEIYYNDSLNQNYFKQQKEINYKMRTILIDWITEIHYKLRLKEETFYSAIYLIDAYLSKKKISRNNFQLLGITSLLISSKLNEIYSIRIKDYSFFTDYAYNTEEIINMESDISKILNFDFLCPTPIVFYQIISVNSGLNQNIEKYNFGKFLIQSFLMDLNSLKYKYSIISLSAFNLVIKLFHLSNYNGIFVKYFSFFEHNSHKGFDVINECSLDIYRSIAEIINSNIKSTIKKYFNENLENNINKLIEMYKC